MKKTVVSAIVALMLIPPLTPRPASADGNDKVAIVAGLGLIGAMIAADRQSRKEQMVKIRGAAAEPDFGVDAFARPGEAVFATYNYDQVSTWITTEDFLTPAGYERKAGQIYYRMVVGKYCKPDGRECVEDKDNDGDLDKVGRTDGKKADVPYEVGFERFPFDGGFRTELLFLGLANGVLRMQYREFLDDLARPAFSQELTYEVHDLPTTLFFQNLRLEVTEAGNQGIAYRAFTAHE